MVGDTTPQDLDVHRGQRNEVSTILSSQPEPPAVGLTVTYQLIRKHTARVTLVGELESLVLGQTRDALLSVLTWAVNWIEVDAGSLSFCDAGGLGLLVDFDKRCAQQAGGLRILNAQPQLTRLLELTEQATLVTQLGSVIGHEEQLERALVSRRYRAGHGQ